MLAKQGKPRGVVELSYKVFNFTEDQDLKLKIGYNAIKQVSAIMYYAIICASCSSVLQAILLMQVLVLY